MGTKFGWHLNIKRLKCNEWKLVKWRKSYSNYANLSSRDSLVARKNFVDISVKDVYFISNNSIKPKSIDGWQHKNSEVNNDSDKWSKIIDMHKLVQRKSIDFDRGIFRGHINADIKLEKLSIVSCVIQQENFGLYLNIVKPYLRCLGQNRTNCIFSWRNRQRLISTSQLLIWRLKIMSV